MSVESTFTPKVASIKSALSFGALDLVDGKLNKYVPLFITAEMASIEVRRILVDQRSFTDINFVDLLDVLNIS